MTVNTNQKPYFDDFDNKKNFHKVLYTPRRAVQVRELNQMQSILQDQLKKFGDHVFEDGSQVIPGESTFDLNYSYVKVVINNIDKVSKILSNEDNTFESTTSDIKGVIDLYVPAADGDNDTFYLKYESAGDDASVLEQDEKINIKTALGDTFATATVVESGVGSKFTVNTGVFYINGYFVYTDKQSIVLDKYSNKPSYSVGFRVEESVVTATNDVTLFDNATGSANYKAPGADRLKIDLVLTKYKADEVTDDFVEIARILDGNLERKARGPEYNILDDVLAKRTYDQSGDYTVEDFKIEIKEHLKTDDIDGIYEADDGGDLDKFVVGVEKGRAYVRGYEVENLSTKYITVDKARETDITNNSSISSQLGFYIELEEPNILPDIKNYQTISFYTGETNGLDTPTGDLLGSARVRFIRKVGDVYRLYVFDMKDTNGRESTSFVSAIKSVYSTEGNTFAAGVNIPSDDYPVLLYDTSDYKAVFPLANSVVKTLLKNGVSDASYTTIRQYDATVDSNGTVVLNTGTDEVFVSQDSQYAMATYTDTGEFVDISSAYELGGLPSGKNITFNLGSGEASRPVRLNVQLVKEATVTKIKTLTKQTITGSLLDDIISLKKADAVSLIKVTDDDDNDVTDAFTLVDNKTPAYYGVSYLRKNNSSITVTEPITIEFDYFKHGPGDFFSVDSYASIDYSDIPKELLDGELKSLSDVLDFRPRMADNGNGFSGVGSSSTSLPVPYTIIRADVEFYKQRIDKLYVDSDGVFGVVKGVPSLKPEEPDSPDNSMVLFKIFVPAYTFNAVDINAQKIKNRRYTMKDIGLLENRISNLEYYVSLNSLERDTADMQVIDNETGLNRFKNGFTVDSFADYSVADFGWSDFRASINPIDSDLRPQFALHGIDLEINEDTSTHYSINDGLVTLPFDEKKYLSQVSSTGVMNVNPYAVFRWSGSLKLVPEVDSWIDTVYTDPDVTYKTFNEGKLTQTWKSWELNWTGSTQTTSTNFTRTTAPHTELSPWGSLMRSTRSFTSTSTTTTSVDVVNDRVIDSSVVPYMRSREVKVNGKGFMPNARLYAFFDGKSVDKYVKPSSGNYNQQLRADGEGNVNAVFKVPNDNLLKFRTGTKQFSLSDDPGNIRENAISFGDALYTAEGVKEVRRKTIVATRSTTTKTVQNSVKWTDPLAQSFLVEMDGGVFLTSIDLWFQTKDKTVPVTVDIREMQNGYPTQNVVPGSSVTLNPSEVNISSNSSAKTNFKFNYPVYLEQGAEYCFVITSNSNKYFTYIAEMGEKEIETGSHISKQPYVGVLFKSQNSSTWTADQTKDLKFIIHRASFDISSTANILMNNEEADYIRLKSNALFTTLGSKDVIVELDQHNVLKGTVVELKGVLGGNSVEETELNKIHTVKEVLDYNRYVIEVDTEATVTGYIGGSSIESSQTMLISSVSPHFIDVVVPDTNISYGLSGTRGKSFSGDENAYEKLNYVIGLSNNNVNEVDEPMIVTSLVDEEVNLNKQKSLDVMAVLQSNKENLSPVLDLFSSNIIGTWSEIDFNDAVEADGSNTWAKYRTKTVGLNSTANSIKTYVDILKPQESDVIISYRTGNSDEEVKNSEWIVMNAVSALTSTDYNQYQENEYGDDEISDFTYYQVMIQMKSKSNVNVPILKRFRVLALGT